MQNGLQKGWTNELFSFILRSKQATLPVLADCRPRPIARPGANTPHERRILNVPPTLCAGRASPAALCVAATDLALGCPLPASAATAAAEAACRDRSGGTCRCCRRRAGFRCAGRPGQEAGGDGDGWYTAGLPAHLRSPRNPLLPDRSGSLLAASDSFKMSGYSRPSVWGLLRRRR